MSKRFPYIAVYIMTDKPRGTLYIGVTANLPQRICAHKEGRGSEFTKRYGLTRLVYYERFEMMSNAIQREKSLKRYSREWKCNLIERENPHWDDIEGVFIVD